jgi:hypothetical protein
MRTLKIHSLKSVKEQPWYDRDYILFHSCFQIFEDFVEKENGIEQWCENEVVPVLKELYDWWQKVKDDEDFDCVTEEAQEKLEKLVKYSRYLWT